MLEILEKFVKNLEKLDKYYVLRQEKEHVIIGTKIEFLEHKPEITQVFSTYKPKPEIKEPKIGDTRILTKFAWFPKIVDNPIEDGKALIWLQYYNKKQQIERIKDAGKKKCANYIRGCRAQLETDYKFSKCQECPKWVKFLTSPPIVQNKIFAQKTIVLPIAKKVDFVTS